MTKFQIIPNRKHLQTPKDNVTPKTEICFGKGRKNVVGKGENAAYQHFLLLSPPPLYCFQKASFSGSFQAPDCVVKGF